MCGVVMVHVGMSPVKACEPMKNNQWHVGASQPAVSQVKLQKEV
jgi:hypothetical protein